MESWPQNTELLFFSISKDVRPFKLEIVNILKAYCKFED